MIRLLSHRAAPGWLAVALIAAVAVAGVVRPAGAADHTVAVALFYAPSPVTTYLGVIPEEYAAADLSAALAASARGGFTVVPSDRVRAAETALRWQEADVLRFARLGELAHAVGADRVVVGWIRQLSVESSGSGGSSDFEPGGGTGGVITGLAVVRFQVFDATQGRIVYETQAEGHDVGALNSLVARGTLNDVDRRGAAQLLGPLTAGP